MMHNKNDYLVLRLDDYKYVNYDHPGECSPEMDCLW